MKRLVLTLFLFVISCVYSQAQVKVTAVNGIAFYGTIVKNDQDSLILMDADRLNVYLTKKNIISIEEIKCTIENKKGDEFVGRIQKYDDNSIILKCDDGTIREFETSKMKITFDGVSSKTLANKNVPNYGYKDLYNFFGITFYTPGGVNLRYGGYVYSNTSLAITAGFMGDIAVGVQGDVLFNVVKKSAVDLNFGFCIGYMNFGTIEDRSSREYDIYYTKVDKSWTYVGGVVDLNINGLFLQPGISIGTGNFSGPQLLFQIGYVYRFNDK